MTDASPLMIGIVNYLNVPVYVNGVQVIRCRCYDLDSKKPQISLDKDEQGIHITLNGSEVDEGTPPPKEFRVIPIRGMVINLMITNPVRIVLGDPQAVDDIMAVGCGDGSGRPPA